jgi:D-hydroxyproline dehydrogenase subunit beta
VIGAGVIGASVAARLAAAGMTVTLLEQDQPGRAASRWSLAWMNSNDKFPRPYHDLNHAGVRAWAELAPGLDGAAWYRPVGHVELAETADQADELAARIRRLTEWGYPAARIDPAEAAALEPSLQQTARAAAAAWFPDEGYLLTEPLIERLVARAKEHGATVLTGDRGRVTALAPGEVGTAAGVTVEADEIVCCAGRWTPRLAELAGAGPDAVPLVAWDTPGATAPGFVVRVGPVPAQTLTRLVHTSNLALRPHPGGLLQLEAPDAAVDLHTPRAELENWAAELFRRAQQTVSGLDDARIVRYQVCVRPMPAGGQSIIGRPPGTDHLYVAVTHSGVTLAAHLSRLIAAELTAAEPSATGPSAELAPYRPRAARAV